MKASLQLKIASLLMVLHAVGHTLGHSGWKKATDPVKVKVITEMTSHAFPFMGVVRSMGEFYDGYGYACTIALLFFAAVLWIISASKDQQTDLSIKILMLTSFCLLCWGIDELVFFFPFAASFSILSSILTGIAAVQLNKQKKA